MTTLAAPLEALGSSQAFLQMQERLAAVAPVNRPVLLLGERGTGKELAAARLHFLSKRWAMPLVRWNCSACPAELVESELFGHEPGSFTGASRRRLGRFEQADGGTLFLDEIGQMPLPVQEKILRVVEYGVFERVGGEESITVDVRVVAATNADLPRACSEGRFREDLLDRLAFAVVRLPPLRERKEDIPVLARHFAARMAAEMGAPAPAFDPRADRQLLAHDWPGNIRELRNVVERAVIHAEEGRITLVELNPFGSDSKAGSDGPKEHEVFALPVDLAHLIQDFRERYVEQALIQTGFHQRRAAALLGLTYDQFRAIYRKSVKAAAGPRAAEIVSHANGKTRDDD